MGIILNAESEYAKELAKHEQHVQPWAPVPGNPYQYRQWPKMLYQARKRDDGRIVCLDERAAVGDPIGEAWNRTTCLTVQSEDEYRRAKNQGWSDSPADAMAKAEALEQAIGNAAAEAAYAVQRMSAKAKAELQAANDATAEHVPDVTPAVQRELGDLTKTPTRTGWPKGKPRKRTEPAA